MSVTTDGNAATRARVRARSHNLEAVRALRAVAEAARKEADRLEHSPESVADVREVNEALERASLSTTRAWALLTLDAAP